MLITRPRASFWYMVCPDLKNFEFWPQMTPKTPNFGVEWPRKLFFVIRGPKAPFEYINCLSLIIFGFWPQKLPYLGSVLLGNHFIVITWPKASFWYILPRFENVFILTPNYSKYPIYLNPHFPKSKIFIRFLALILAIPISHWSIR